VQVLSICCANLLIFIMRTVLTFVIMHSIMESRNNAVRRTRRGLSREGMGRLRRMSSGKAGDGCPTNMCSICLSNFEENDGLVILPCDERHAFHEECIGKWLRKNNNCPLCQRTVQD
jgi:hypothetical protein